MNLKVIPRREPTHSAVFLEHYASLRAWALRLTDGEQAEAEDVLHDAFVQFVRLAPELSTIGNTGAYLNRLLRNLHLAHINRRSRMQYVYLDALEFDSLSLSMRGAHPLRSRELEEELKSICRWTVARRQDKRAASFLILRFFLGYLPSEICKLCVCGRESLEKGLQSARGEIRKAKSGREWPGQKQDGEAIALQDWLNRTIFDSTGNGCLSPETLRQTLAEHTGERRPLERALLAHLTSCTICLEQANRTLDIASLSDRSFDPPDGPQGSGGSDRADLLLRRAVRSSAEIFEHRPARVELCVNAEPQMSFTVQSPRTVLKVDVSRAKPVSFIEAFSEQGVRLLYMPVTSPDEGGEFQQRTLLHFSEGRALSVEIAFRNPNTEIVICYTDPHQRVMPFAVDAAPELPRNDGRRSWWPPRGDWIHDLWRPMRPAGVWAWAVVLVLIFLLPVTQDEQVMLSAEEVLHRADIWETQVPNADSVIHRSFDYTESAHGGKSGAAQRRRMHVEVWSSAAHRRTLRKLINAAGKTEDSTSAPLPATPTAGTAWEYVPDAESFRVLAGSQAMRVNDEGGEVRLSTANAWLLLARASYHPTQQGFRMADSDVHISEVASEVVPLASSPLHEQGQESSLMPLAPLPTRAELDEAELSVRERLHALHADLGDDIRISRTPRNIRVAGVIDPGERRAMIEADLRRLRYVQLALLSPAEAARNEHLLHVQANDSGAMAAPLLQPWLKSEWPDTEGRDRYVQQLLRAADRCNEHMLALSSLQARYPNSEDPRVKSLERDHAYAMGDQADLLLSLLPTAGAGHEQGAQTLDTAALLATTQRLNEDLERLFTVHSATTEGTQADASLERSRQSLAAIAHSVRVLIP